VIPRSAVVSRGSLNCVMFLTARGLRNCAYITLGAAQGNLVEVLSGVSSGEKLVDSPSDRELAGKRIETSTGAGHEAKTLELPGGWHTHSSTPSSQCYLLQRPSESVSSRSRSSHAKKSLKILVPMLDIATAMPGARPQRWKSASRCRSRAGA